MFHGVGVESYKGEQNSEIAEKRKQAYEKTDAIHANAIGTAAQ